MPEKKSPDSSAIHGLSIVDTSTNDTGPIDEEEGNKVGKSRANDLVMKIEDEVDATTGHDDAREQPAAEDTYLEEAEDKINLFDVFNEKAETEKNNKSTFQNSTLIISTEEHLDTTCDDTLNTSTETVKNIKTSTSATNINPDSSFEESKKTVIAKPKPKSDDHSYFWVSNITRHVKAADLKKFFSQVGKVMTVKILTNGKNYFGYVSVDSTETAVKCIKQLNNAPFEGRRIAVSKDRPDLRETKSMARTEPRRKRVEKIESKKEEKVAEEKHNEQKKTKAATEEANEIAELEKQLDKSRAEVGRYKWKMVEYQRRHDGMRKKCDSLEKELENIKFQMRTDRRRLNQDREQFEKNKKMEQNRLEADKAVINKELAEVKKLRENLKEKIEEIKVQSKKTMKRRSRSPPVPVQRSRSPVLRIGSRVAYRSNDRLIEKKRKHDAVHGRTPPPPPKLSSNGVGKKRSDNLPSHRPSSYFENVEKRLASIDHGHGYEYRHKSSFIPSQEMSARPPWQTSYTKDPRRIGAAPSSGQSYSADPRYAGEYQFPPSSIAPPPRSYYPEFGKPYGHY